MVKKVQILQRFNGGKGADLTTSLIVIYKSKYAFCKYPHTQCCAGQPHDILKFSTSSQARASHPEVKKEISFLTNHSREIEIDSSPILLPGDPSSHLHAKFTLTSLLTSAVFHCLNRKREF